MHLITFLAALALFGAADRLRSVVHATKDVSYNVPNPFRKPQDGFYFIRSSQTTFSSHRKRSQVEVDEYFSLSEGVSYSLHTMKVNELNSVSWATLSFGGKSYIVRDAGAKMEPEELDCELDHVHNQRQVFPWQYSFDLAPARHSTAELLDVGLLPESESSRGKAKRRKNREEAERRRRRRAQIYGIGAIWLNAIDRNIKSAEVGRKSRFSGSNVWTISEELSHLSVDLLFDKTQAQVEETHSNNDEEELENWVVWPQEELDASKLNGVRVDRRHSIDSNGHLAPDSKEAPLANLNDHEYIVVEKFASGLQVETDDVLKELQSYARKCARLNRKHRVFPSLMRALSVSPQRLYFLQYVVHKTNRLQSDKGQFFGQYDERRHRFTYADEHVTEAFSFKSETQTFVYEQLHDAVNANKPGRGRTDVFMHKLTEKHDTLNAIREAYVAPKRSYASYYHLMEYDNLAEDSCKHERELVPEQAIFRKPLYFYRSEQVRLRGLLTGLGALLLNAADSHYKHFSLFKRKIFVRENPLDLSETRQVLANEWQIQDKRSGWMVHFYFEHIRLIDERPELNSKDPLVLATAEIGRLVRVEVRDLAAIADESTDEVYVSSGERSDYDLVAQFDILRFEFEMNDEDMKFAFTRPSLCDEVQDEGKDDDDGDGSYGFADDAHELPALYDEAGDESEAGDEPRKEWQDEAVEFELEPGEEAESFDLPDFFDKMDGRTSYEIASKIELLTTQASDSDDEQSDAAAAKQPRVSSSKHIWLNEFVNLEQEISILNIYYSDKNFELKRADETYYINYESELVFRLAADGSEDAVDPLQPRQCVCLQDLHSSTSWLRLFSAPITYYTVPVIKPDSGQVSQDDVWNSEKNGAVFESNKLRLFGLGALWRRATNSDFVYFAGRRKKLLSDGKSDAKFREMVWLYEEGDTSLRFNFWQQVDEGKNEEEHPLELNSIESNNWFGSGDEKTIKATVVSIRFQKEIWGKELMLPNACRSALTKAIVSQSVPPQENVKPPKLNELFGKWQSVDRYKLKYRIAKSSLDPLQQLEAAPSSDKKPAKKPKRVETSITIEETFDRLRNRAKLVVSRNQQEAQVFIEGREKKRYLFSNDQQSDRMQCKQISTLRTLIDMGQDLNDVLQNYQFNADSMYGLAGVWKALAEHEKLTWTLRRYTRADLTGRKHEVLSYFSQVFEHTKGNSKRKVAHEVKMVYRTKRVMLKEDHSSQVDNFRPGEVKFRGQMQLFLESIHVWPSRISTGLLMPDDLDELETRIFIRSLEVGDQVSDVDWALPAVCSQPDSSHPFEPSGGKSGSGDAGPSSTRPADKFPLVSELIAFVKVFHMKSEMTVYDAKLNENRLYVVDEWYEGATGNYRARFAGLGKASNNDFEFIILGSSKEIFDVSNQFDCRPALPSKAQRAFGRFDASEFSNSNLVEFWSPASSRDKLVSRLSHLYYAPYALWRLAERNLNNIGLLNWFDLAPSEPLGGDLLTEKEMRSNTWHVTGPPVVGSSTWSYNMKFVTNSHLEAGAKEPIVWQTLESVEVKDLPADRVISVDVLSYRYHEADWDTLERFRLPEGWGCVRKSFDKTEPNESHTVEEFALGDEAVQSTKSTSGYRLNYEASLQLVDGVEQTVEDLELGSFDVKTHVTLPVLGGDVIAYAGLDDSYDAIPSRVYAHYARARFASGEFKSTKIVYDSGRKLAYHLSRLTGDCAIASVSPTDWALSFDMPEKDMGTKLIIFSPELISTLFLFSNEQGFKPVNKIYSKEEKSTRTSYEKFLDELELTEDLRGPARIVRKFDADSQQSGVEVKPKSPNSGKLIKYHKTMSVRVFLFDLNDKTKLRALLDMRLTLIPDILFSEFLNSINVFQCFNEAVTSDGIWDKQIGRYSLEYTLGEADKKLARSLQMEIGNQIAKLLVLNTQLSPMQLDGNIRVEFTPHDNLMRVHFNVLDAPSAHLFLTEKVLTSLSDELETRAELRMLPNLESCSHWCDQLNCVAMSYCYNWACKVVSESAFSYNSEGDLESERDRRVLVEGKTDGFCTYFYRSHKEKAMKLDQFSGFMQKKINLAGDSSSLALSLQSNVPTLNGGNLTPIRFYETHGKFRWQHEDADDPNYGHFDVVEGDRASAQMVATLKVGQTIDSGKLNKFIQDEATGLLTSTVRYVDQPSHCWRPNDEELDEDQNSLLISLDTKLKLCTRVFKAKREEPFELPVELYYKLKEATFVDMKDRSILIRDHLHKFRKFERTLVPKSSVSSLNDLSRVECALICQIQGDKCLSFDYCTYKQASLAEATSVCMLQRSHVVSTELSTSKEGTIAVRQDYGVSNKIEQRDVTCDHYSKSLLADYKQIANRRLTEPESSTLRGVSADRCALDCQQDESCQAFEYCVNKDTCPTQSCYLITNFDDLLGTANSKNELIGENKDLDAKQRFGSHLKVSEICSIFLPKQFAFEEKLSQVLHSSTWLDDLKSVRLSHTFSTGCIYLGSAILIGVVIQLIYSKFSGQTSLLSSC